MKKKNYRYCRYWKFGTINSSIQHLLHREKPSKFTDVGKHRGAGTERNQSGLSEWMSNYTRTLLVSFYTSL